MLHLLKAHDFKLRFKAGLVRPSEGSRDQAHRQHSQYWVRSLSQLRVSIPAQQEMAYAHQAQTPGQTDVQSNVTGRSGLKLPTR